MVLISDKRTGLCYNGEAALQSRCFITNNKLLLLHSVELSCDGRSSQTIAALAT